MIGELAERRWTVRQVSEIAGIQVATARWWLDNNIISDTAQGDEREAHGWRRLNFVALLHLALTDRLSRCGVTAQHGSEIVARFVDAYARRAVEMEGDPATKATNVLANMIVHVRVAPDGGKPTAAAETLGRFHRLSDRLEGDYCSTVYVGPVVKELVAAIERAALEQSKGRA